MPHRKASLGANLSVKNEEHRILRQHLINLREFCDEIVVGVDESSSDNSYEICRELADQVYHIKAGDYSENVRRAGREKLTTSWELWVDADFIFPKETQQEILACINSDDYLCYEIPAVNFAFGQWLTDKKLWFYHLRLMHIESVDYRRKDLHNWDFTFSGKKGMLQNPLLHYGYESIEHYIKNMNFYTGVDTTRLSRGAGGGLFQREMGSINQSQLVQEPMRVFDQYFNAHAYKEASSIGAILSWLQAFYSFTEKAKVFEHKLKEETGFVAGKIEPEKVMEEIREQQAHAKTKARASSVKSKYKIRKILRGLTPPYLYKALNLIFKFE